jgi:hypothetical protein
MTTITYTVFRTARSDESTAGLSLAEAAEALLTADGNIYAIRPETDGVGRRLWLPAIDGRLIISRFFSLAAEAAEAEREIFAAVVATDDWSGMEAMPDADFAEMRAAALADEQE